MSINIKKIEKQCFVCAEQSKAVKRKVGAVIADSNGEILATGCNYNPDGSACEDEKGNTKPEVIHAEVACIENFFNSLHKYKTIEAPLTLYVTHPPCENCKNAIVDFEFEGTTLDYKVIDSFMKFSTSKPRMNLVPPSLGQAAARALTYGAKKYKVNNWRQAKDVEEFINACIRHLDDWRNSEGDPLDESGLSHLDHFAANAAFLIELKHLPKIKTEDNLK